MSELRSGGLDFTGVLTLILITLKLCGVIHCSWWIVFLPALITTSTAMVLGLCLLFIRNKKGK